MSGEDLIQQIGYATSSPPIALTVCMCTTTATATIRRPQDRDHDHLFARPNLLRVCTTRPRSISS